MKLLILATGFLLSSFAFAEGGFIPPDFGFDAGLSMGLGSMGNHSQAIPGRTMDTLALHVMPDYKISDLSLGLNFEYDLTGQTSDPVNSLNQNLKGHGWLLGVAGQYHFRDLWKVGDLIVSVGMDFLGTYSPSLNSLSGLSTSYTHPLGYRIGVGYPVCHEATIDLAFRQDWYGHFNNGPTTTNISTDRLEQTNWSLGATYHY